MPIDHWYQLHVTTFGNRYGIDDLKFGPLDQDGLIDKVQELLKAKADLFGRVPIEAEVVRVDMGKGIHFRAGDGKWSKVSAGLQMEHMPRRVAPDKDLNDVPLLQERRPMKHMKALVVVGHRNGGCDLWLATPKPSVGNRRKLLWAFSERNLETDVTVYEASLTFERRVTVDLLTLAEELERKPQMKSIGGRGTFKQLSGKPVVGFRTWLLHVPTVVANRQIVDGEPRLFGPGLYFEKAAVYEWKDAEHLAVCSEVDHKAPFDGCDCGIYAKHEDSEIIYQGRPDEPGTYVRGIVLGTGDLLIHRLGWRAEAARIVGFEAETVKATYLPALRTISQRFDVPILPRQQLLEVALKRGRILNKRDVSGL